MLGVLSTRLLTSWSTMRRDVLICSVWWLGRVGITLSVWHLTRWHIYWWHLTPLHMSGWHLTMWPLSGWHLTRWHMAVDWLLLVCGGRGRVVTLLTHIGRFRRPRILARMLLWSEARVPRILTGSRVQLLTAQCALRVKRPLQTVVLSGGGGSATGRGRLLMLPLLVFASRRRHLVPLLPLEHATVVRILAARCGATQVLHRL